MTRVAIFVDTQNVYYTVREAYRKHFDYRRFWARVTANREVLAARCYATDKGDTKQREFQNILRSIG
ncbi:NYN domain-containing protein, partial [Chromohalobacter sp. 296-RDG]|uniref:NYN domain-containing protein n=1 Tax=Chromohalobacter sp. 296-RDG TaxID=2994062 RepID=UPI002468D3DF